MGRGELQHRGIVQPGGASSAGVGAQRSEGVEQGMLGHVEILKRKRKMRGECCKDIGPRTPVEHCFPVNSTICGFYHADFGAVTPKATATCPLQCAPADRPVASLR